MTEPEVTWPRPAAFGRRGIGVVRDDPEVAEFARAVESRDFNAARPNLWMVRAVFIRLASSGG